MSPASSGYDGFNVLRGIRRSCKLPAPTTAIPGRSRAQTADVPGGRDPVRHTMQAAEPRNRRSSLHQTRMRLMGRERAWDPGKPVAACLSGADTNDTHKPALRWEKDPGSASDFIEFLERWNVSKLYNSRRFFD
jgi:hypothetical protein